MKKENYCQQDTKWITKWKILKEFVINRPDCAGYDVKHNGYRVILDILDKIQELEGEDEN